MLSQSLLPKSLGRGIEPSFMDFVNLVKKGKKMAQKVENRPAFMEGIPKELSRAAEVVNEPFLRKSELPSANFHASAKSLAKLAAMMANFGEGLEGNQRLMTHETWLKMHANEKRAFDAAMHGNKCCFHPILVTWFLVVFGNEVMKILRNSLLIFCLFCLSCLANEKHRTENHTDEMYLLYHLVCLISAAMMS